MSVEPTNVLGTALLPCSYDPLTGYFVMGAVIRTKTTAVAL